VLRRFGNRSLHRWYGSNVTAPTLPLERLRKEIAGHEWYHTIELAPGITTPGWFDTRRVVDRLPWPASLAGKRCLDVGTFDGFWAFEMERRGAERVVAIDLLDPADWDWPANSPPEVVEALGRRKAGGLGFELAHRALDSSVERIELSVYDLDPAEVGEFDFVYVGSILMALRDPLGALERVRGVCTGRLLVVDNIDLPLSLAFRRRPMASLEAVGRPWWWKPNVAALARMVEAAGFRLVRPPERIDMPAGPGQPRVMPKPRTLRHKTGRELFFNWWRGDPHAAVLAQPV
jgi:tRNA (mo5U34)-methyltransferase